jgi:hypothetical protein
MNSLCLLSQSGFVRVQDVTGYGMESDAPCAIWGQGPGAGGTGRHEQAAIRVDMIQRGSVFVSGN